MRGRKEFKQVYKKKNKTGLEIRSNENEKWRWMGAMSGGGGREGE